MAPDVDLQVFHGAGLLAVLFATAAAREVAARLALLLAVIEFRLILLLFALVALFLGVVFLLLVLADLFALLAALVRLARTLLLALALAPLTVAGIARARALCLLLTAARGRLAGAGAAGAVAVLVVLRLDQLVKVVDDVLLCFACVLALLQLGAGVVKLILQPVDDFLRVLLLDVRRRGILFPLGVVVLDGRLIGGLLLGRLLVGLGRRRIVGGSEESPHPCGTPPGHPVVSVPRASPLFSLLALS